MQKVSRRVWGLRLRRTGLELALSPLGHAAFRRSDGVGVPIGHFRSSIPSPPIPLFTLHCAPRGTQRKTRGRVDRYSFLVRIFHSLLPAGLSRRTRPLYFGVCDVAERHKVFPATTADSPYMSLRNIADFKPQKSAPARPTATRSAPASCYLLLAVGKGRIGVGGSTQMSGACCDCGQPPIRATHHTLILNALAIACRLDCGVTA